MTSYRYILEPYKGMKTRYLCPKCNKREFVRYIDAETGRHLSPAVGRCNRESNCGYHYTPKQYFEDNKFEISRDADLVKLFPPIHKNPSFVPVEIFITSLNSHEPNNFVRFLLDLFGVDITNGLISRYFITASTHWPGATIFWQVDLMGKVRTGKIMLYNPTTGKRIKEPFNHITWAHSALKLPSFELKQCLFGEHLLRDKSKPVAIVESEKTAVISSVYLPQFTWLACGSINNLNADKCKVLAGRKVVLFPDLNAFDKWSAKAKELSHLANFTTSELLERKATEAEREQGLDLADYLLRFSFQEFAEPERITEPVLKPFDFEAFRGTVKPKRENWISELSDMERFFEVVKLPEAPIKLDECSTITDISKFIQSHLDIVKSQNGNGRYLPYLERLRELKKILKQQMN